MRWSFHPGRAVTALGIVVAAVSASPAWCQGVDWGVRAGATVTGLLFRDPYSQDNSTVRTGFHVGVPLRLEVSRRWVIETELGYVRKGFKDTGAHFGSQILDYVEVPFLVGLRSRWRISPHVMVGPYASYMVHCRITDVVGIDSTACDDPLVAMKRKPLDFGGIVGLGVEQRTGGVLLTLDVRASLGFRDLKTEPLPPGSIRNVAIHFVVGVFPHHGVDSAGNSSEVVR